MIKTKTISITSDDISATTQLDTAIRSWQKDNQVIKVIDIKYNVCHVPESKLERTKSALTHSAMIIYKEVEPVTFDKIMEYIKASEELVKRVRKELGHFQYDSNSDEGESLGGRA